jgi:acetyltransferase-like isoleucine patch superfamily enzyme
MINTKKMIVVRILFKFLPLLRCNNLKTIMLRWANIKVGNNLEISSSAKIIGNMDLEIGDNCFIGHEALIFGAYGSKIIMENYSKVGSRVIVVTGSHRFSVDGYCVEKEGTFKDIHICSGAVVSTGSTILPGVIVGKMSHVAAGSVVTKNVPEYNRVAGVPAKVIRDLRDL